MSIRIHCESCGIKRKVNDRLAGRRVRCPECEQPIRVPKIDTDPATPTQTSPETSGPDSAAQMADDSISEMDVPAVPLPSLASIASDETDHSIVAMTAPLEDETTSDADGEASNVPAATETIVMAVKPSEADDEDDEELDEVLVRTKRPEEEMDMTPMVDVTFLLLIFFMVTAAFSLQKSIEMPPQRTEAPSSTVQEEQEDQSEIVEVEINELGSYLVLAADWERETPGKQNLIAALREAGAGAKDGLTLKVKVHEMAKIKALVDVMDAGTIASYSPIEVTQVDQFE